MPSNRSYFVFCCPDCGLYGLAPEGQRTRLCVRCGKTIVIDPFRSRRVDSSEAARILVSEQNARRIPETISGLPIEKPPPSRMGQKQVFVKTTGKGLLRRLSELASKYANKEVQVQEFIAQCEKADIPSRYAEKYIKELLDGGQAYQPRKGWIRFL